MAAPLVHLAVGKVQTVIIQLATVAAATANRARYRLPQKARIIRVAASCQAKTGGMADCKLMLEAGGTNLLSAGIDLGAAGNAAGAYVEGAIAAAQAVQEKETEITLDVDTLTAGQSLTDVTVQIDYLPED